MIRHKTTKSREIGSYTGNTHHGAFSCKGKNIVNRFYSGWIILNFSKILYVDMPAGCWNFDFQYTYFCSNLPPISIQISYKTPQFCSNWVLFTTICLEYTQFMYIGHLHQRYSPLLLQNVWKNISRRHAHTHHVNARVPFPVDAAVSNLKHRHWQAYIARFSLHQVHSSQCTKENYSKYSWRTLADVCMVSEVLRVVPCCQLLL